MRRSKVKKQSLIEQAAMSLHVLSHRFSYGNSTFNDLEQTMTLLEEMQNKQLLAGMGIVAAEVAEKIGSLAFNPSLAARAALFELQNRTLDKRLFFDFIEKHLNNLPSSHRGTVHALIEREIPPKWLEKIKRKPWPLQFVGDATRFSAILYKAYETTYGTINAGSWKKVSTQRALGTLKRFIETVEVTPPKPEAAVAAP